MSRPCVVFATIAPGGGHVTHARDMAGAVKVAAPGAFALDFSDPILHLGLGALDARHAPVLLLGAEMTYASTRRTEPATEWFLVANDSLRGHVVRRGVAASRSGVIGWPVRDATATSRVGRYPTAVVTGTASSTVVAMEGAT